MFGAVTVNSHGVVRNHEIGRWLETMLDFVQVDRQVLDLAALETDLMGVFALLDFIMPLPMA